MTASIYMFGEDSSVRITADGDEKGGVWLRDNQHTIYLGLTAQQRKALRDALDESERTANPHEVTA